MGEINTIKILQHNVLAWKTHKAELKQIYLTLNPDIILINANGCKDEGKIKIYPYTVIQKNITDEAYDGAAIAVRRDIRFQFISLREMLAIRLELAREEIVIATG